MASGAGLGEIDVMEFGASAGDLETRQVQLMAAWHESGPRLPRAAPSKATP